MKILGNRVLVKKTPEEKTEGFKAVAVQDDFVYKGVVVQIGLELENNTNFPAHVGDTILFTKYSPDTHEIEHDGEKMKVVAMDDILAVL
jgi:co-chaperonin GroES (HSP10)